MSQDRTDRSRNRVSSGVAIRFVSRPTPEMPIVSAVSHGRFFSAATTANDNSNTLGPSTSAYRTDTSRPCDSRQPAHRTNILALRGGIQRQSSHAISSHARTFWIA